MRDVGGDLSGQIEVISVEVKRGSQPFATASGQASGYKIYANKVYLADARDKGFKPDEITIASHLGIGLIQIRNGQCAEILSSPFYRPPEKYNLLLLEQLCLGRCQFCECFFETGTGKHRFSKVARENIRLAIEKSRGLMFWNRVVGPRKLKLRDKKSDQHNTFERRFICPDCIDLFRYLFKEIEKVRG